MMITDILTRERVLPELAATHKEAALKELAGLLATAIPNPIATPEQLASILRERERLNSTAIGDGIAIPHGRLSGIRNVVAGFARSSRGIDFESVDRAPTHLFFVLMAPDDAAAQHLKALARISRLLKSAAFREHLLALSSADEIYEAIVAEDRKA
jgi:PTS system nitrogen regulatory IIA component